MKLKMICVIAVFVFFSSTEIPLLKAYSQEVSSENISTNISTNKTDKTETVFKLSPVVESVCFGVGAVLTGTEFALGKWVIPKSTEFDGKILDYNTVNGFDRWAMNDYSRPLHLTATGLEAAAILLPAILMTTSKNNWFTIGTMYAETVLLAYGTKELGKVLINRARPYMYFDGYPEKDIESGDWLCSTPSGHTTMSFAGATFTSYVFAQYFPDSPFKIPVIAGSLSLATGIGIMRILSGNHFLTDVLAGAAIGSAIGFVVPFVHTLNMANINSKSKKQSLSFEIIPDGFKLQVSF